MIDAVEQPESNSTNLIRVWCNASCRKFRTFIMATIIRNVTNIISMAAQYNEFIAPFQGEPSHFCTGKYTQGGPISCGQGIAEKNDMAFNIA